MKSCIRIKLTFHSGKCWSFSNERSFLVYILLEAPQRPKERIPQPHVPYFYLLRPNFAKIWNLWDFGFFKWIPRARACTRGSSEFTDFSSVFEKSSKMEDRGRRLFHYILWGFTEGFRVSFHNIYKNAMLVLGTFQPALRFFFNFHITPRARACTRKRLPSHAECEVTYKFSNCLKSIQNQNGVLINVVKTSFKHLSTTSNSMVK